MHGNVIRIGRILKNIELIANQRDKVQFIFFVLDLYVDFALEKCKVRTRWTVTENRRRNWGLGLSRSVLCCRLEAI